MENLIARDLNHVWHPCMNMRYFNQYPPLVIQKAKGSYIYTDRGALIDGIASWWCKSLGHQHPAIMTAMKQQLDEFDHVITATTTNRYIVQLAEELTNITNKQHIFFASDGSCAVEIALKLAIHAKRLSGQPEKTKFIGLQQGYHGETIAALSVSDLPLYKKPFESLTLSNHFIPSLPYVSDQADPIWHQCGSYWDETEKKLDTLKHDVCAIILEPILQGAGGMKIYSADFLTKLVQWAKMNNIYVIADEIMTGLGRTGRWLAMQHTDKEADIICLSKGLTSGSTPFSCVLIDHDIFDLFYHAGEQGEAFLHSHTFGGHPVGVRAALATLDIMRTDNINEQAEQLGQKMRAYFNDIANHTGKLHNIRSIGAMVAAELAPSSYNNIGYRFANIALEHGALLRPLGQTLYWFPPINISEQTLEKLANITCEAIIKSYEQQVY